MIYLVTGGAGFLGINLVRYLLKRGNKVRSIDLAPFNHPERDEIEVVQADIRDRQAVDKAMRGTDIVVHCAAALPLYDRDSIVSTQIDGTRTLLESALAEKVDRFINISSTAVYGVPDHHPICETAPLHGVGPYGDAKIRAEELCRTFRARGLCIPILRPKSFVGPERLGVFELLFNWACEGRNFPIIGPGNNHYQLLDVEDLCQAILLCATCDKGSVNDEFNVGAREFGTLRQDFQAVLDRAGYGKRIVGIPAWPAIRLLKLFEVLGISPLYHWVYDTIPNESVVSIDRITARLRFSPLYSNKEALVRNYDWYVANRALFLGTTGVSHRVPWNHGILQLARYLL